MLREKVPNVLSRVQTKRRMGGEPVHPSFGMTPTVSNLKKKNEYFWIFFLSRFQTKRIAGAAPRARPSFGMTPT